MVLRENRHFMFEEDKTTMFILKFNLNMKTYDFHHFSSTNLKRLCSKLSENVENTNGNGTKSEDKILNKRCYFSRCANILP